RKSPLDEFERGWRRCFAGAVVVRIGLETVVEKRVLVILSVTLGEGTNKDQTEQAQNPTRPVPGRNSLNRHHFPRMLWVSCSVGNHAVAVHPILRTVRYNLIHGAGTDAPIIFVCRN